MCAMWTCVMVVYGTVIVVTDYCPNNNRGNWIIVIIHFPWLFPDFSYFSWLFPDHFSIPWLFQVFQKSGHPASVKNERQHAWPCRSGGRTDTLSKLNGITIEQRCPNLFDRRAKCTNFKLVGGQIEMPRGKGMGRGVPIPSPWAGSEAENEFWRILELEKTSDSHKSVIFYISGTPRGPDRNAWRAGLWPMGRMLDTPVIDQDTAIHLFTSMDRSS